MLFVVVVLLNAVRCGCVAECCSLCVIASQCIVSPVECGHSSHVVIALSIPARDNIIFDILINAHINGGSRNSNRSNLLGTKFTVYDSGLNPAKTASSLEASNLRQELAAICYVSTYRNLK